MRFVTRLLVGWLIDFERPGKQFFSHVGTEPPLPGYYQYFWGVNVHCSRTQHGLTRVGLEPPTSGSGVQGIYSNTRPPRSHYQVVQYTVLINACLNIVQSKTPILRTLYKSSTYYSNYFQRHFISKVPSRLRNSKQFQGIFYPPNMHNKVSINVVSADVCLSKIFETTNACP